MVQVQQQAAAGQQGHLAGLRELAGRVLEAEGPHVRGRRADEGDAGVLAGLGEAGVLRQEAVAGMDGLGAALPGDGQQRVLPQVTLCSQGRPDAVGLVGLAHMPRARVGL